MSHIPVIYMIVFVHSPSVIFAEATELEIHTPAGLPQSQYIIYARQSLLFWLGRLPQILS